MVVADTPRRRSRASARSRSSSPSPTGPADRVIAWQKTQELRSGKVHALGPQLRAAAGADRGDRDDPRDGAGRTVTHKLRLAGNEQLELYDYPGGYAERFDGVDPGGGDQPADLQKIFARQQPDRRDPHAGGGRAERRRAGGSTLPRRSRAGTRSRSSATSTPTARTC